MSGVRRAWLTTCFNHTCATLTRFRLAGEESSVMRTMMRVVLAVCSIGAVPEGWPARAQYYYPTPGEYDGPRDYDGPRVYDGPRDFDGPRQTWNGCPRLDGSRGKLRALQKVPLVEDGTHRTAARPVTRYRAASVSHILDGSQKGCLHLPRLILGEQLGP